MLICRESLAIHDGCACWAAPWLQADFKITAERQHSASTMSRRSISSHLLATRSRWLALRSGKRCPPAAPSKRGKLTPLHQSGGSSVARSARVTAGQARSVRAYSLPMTYDLAVWEGDRPDESSAAETFTVLYDR